MGFLDRWRERRHPEDNPVVDPTVPTDPVDPNNPIPVPVEPDHRIGWRIRLLAEKLGAFKELLGSGWTAIIIVAILVGIVWYFSAAK